MQEHPDRIISFAVDGMVPHNHLHDKVMKRLKVYAGPEAGKVAEVAPVQDKAKPKRALIRKIVLEVKAAPKKEAKR